MLPRRLRLSRKQFESAGSGGRLMRAQSPHFGVSFGPIEGKGGAGVVVTKKVERSSVKRHVLKRRIREAIRPLVSTTHALIVYARPGSQNLSYQDIESELTALIGRVQG